MKLCNSHQLLERCILQPARTNTIIGIDWGASKVGLAAVQLSRHADFREVHPKPLTTLRLSGHDPGTKSPMCYHACIRKPFADPQRTLATGVRSILMKHQCSNLVVGWPLERDGTAGTSCRRVTSFCREALAQPLYISGIHEILHVVLMDERGSTVAARQHQDGAPDAGMYSLHGPRSSRAFDLMLTERPTTPLRAAVMKRADSVAASLLLQQWLERCVPQEHAEQ